VSVASFIFFALAAAHGSFDAPGRTALARALEGFTRKHISAATIRHVSCTGFKEEPTEAACKWEQKSLGKWQRFSSYLAVDSRGWHLIDEPNRESSGRR
jgi:hypothetical protein